ncbi:MAG: glycosyl hydrolase family 95 catalytic domain-containing protein, partial [Armatimonadota bacterium]
MDPNLALRFDGPARSFLESLPLGNGRMGAMVFGGDPEEKIVLNELTLWSGSPEEADRPDAAKALPEIRRLLFAGRPAEAEALVNASFTCKGAGSGHANGADLPYGCYQMLANLFVRDLDAGKRTRHRRTLTLEDAVATVEVGDSRGTQRRETFVSHPDRVLAMRWTTDAPGGLHIEARLDRPKDANVRLLPGNDLVLEGALPDGHGGRGTRFAARLRVLVDGKSVPVRDLKAVVEGAREVLFLVACATTFRRKSLPDLGATLSAAAARGWNVLRTRHVQDQGALFGRVALDLGEARGSEATTPARLERARTASDPALAALLFQYGRYLMVASSRAARGTADVALPANLQGIWAEELQTPWNGDYHLDINVQMNYWPAETTGLSECHRPLLDFIATLVEPGKRTAKAYYGAEGWVAHVITNVWGFTAPGEHASWGSSNHGAGWLCRHLWDHWDFTRDRRFLAEAWPILRDAARFYVDFLVEDPRTGKWVTAPSNSPENSYRTPDGKVAHTCVGPVIDIQIVRELFSNVIAASGILGIEREFAERLGRMCDRLPEHKVGKQGQLLEWQEEFEENEPLHRHVSHLYGLYPSDQIDPRTTPNLAVAAAKTLERRGDGGTGWSLAWKVAFRARLGDGA